MRSYILLIISFLSLSDMISAQVVWTESFNSGGWALDGGIYNKWVISNKTDLTDIQLLKQKNLRITCDTCSAEQPSYQAGITTITAKMNSDISGSILANPNLALAFYYKVNGNATTDYANLIYSVNGGSSWNTYYSVKFFDVNPEWKRIHISLSDLVGWTPGSNLRLGFQWNSTTSTSCGMIVDEMSIYSQEYQVKNVNQLIYVAPNTTLTFKNADVINQSAASIVNNGALDFSSNFENQGLFSSYASTAKVKLSGTSLQSLAGTISVGKLELSNSLSNEIAVIYKGQITSSDSLFFNSGILASPELSDTLSLANTSKAVNPGSHSFVSGIVQRRTPTSHVFPIGDGHEGRYRPITLNVASSTPNTNTSFYYRNKPFAGTYDTSLDGIFTPSYWKGSVDQGKINQADVTLSFVVGGWEGSINKDSARVAFSPTLNGEYTSFGNQYSTSTSVRSENTDTLGFFTLGDAKDARLNINAFLQGNLNEGALLMSDVLSSYTWGGSSYTSILDSVVKNDPTLRMQRSYTVPNGAVDIIKIELRTSNTSVYDVHGVTWAWLLNDGSVRDFKTGIKSYATFSRLGQTATPVYYPVIYHRNHIPVMYNTPIQLKFGTPITADFTQYANVFGGGAYTFGINRAALYLGNAVENIGEYYEVNSSDFIKVSLANDGNPEIVYMQEDINLDGVVNADDFTAVQIANDNLYSTTIP